MGETGKEQEGQGYWNCLWGRDKDKPGERWEHLLPKLKLSSEGFDLICRVLRIERFCGQIN